jgi:uncharacterized protein involved in exopolysaccharide biosynthesis
MHYPNHQTLVAVSDKSLSHSTATQDAGTDEQHSRRLVEMLKNHWKYLSFCSVLSVVVGFVVAERSSTLRWTQETTLLYSKPAAIASYTPPDADSLSKLFKSKNTLLKLSEEFQHAFSAEQVDRSLTVDPPYGSCILHVSLAWPDRDQGAAMLNRTVELFRQQVAQQRDQSLQQVAKGIRASRQRCKQELTEARQAGSDFAKSQGVIDVNSEMTVLRGSLAELERDLATARSEQATKEARFRTIGNPNNVELPGLIEDATLATRKIVAELELLLGDRRREHQRLMDIHKDAHELEQDLVSLSHEKQRLDDELSVIEQLCAEETSGFTVVQPATESLGSPTSNKRKLLFGLSLLLGLMLFAPIMALEAAHNRESAIKAWARRLGLQLLVHEKSSVAIAEEDFGTPASYDAMRLLALRIQQSVKQPGSAILFCGLNSNPTPDWLLWNLARCLSERGERVLLVHSELACACEQDSVPATANDNRLLAGHSSTVRNSAGSDLESTTAVDSGRGLAAYLTAGSLDLERLIDPTQLVDVDQLQLGDCPLPREAWGTQRMNELLYRLRERYSLILFSGPTIEQPIDLQMLAARVDGIIFSMPDKCLVSPMASAVVRDLTQMHAPILGLIA